MIPDEINSYLESVSNGHTEWAREHASESMRHLTSLGIDPDSDLVELYTRFGWGFRTRVARFELLAPNEMDEWTAYAHEELGVPRNFVALTSNEGQGIMLLNRETGAVYDVEYGQFELLDNGSLAPIANSVADFLLWYVGDEP